MTPSEHTCQFCHGPYEFDTSVPSVMWNCVIRAAGLPEYLCLTCIVRFFALAEHSFTAELSGLEFKGLPIEVIINGQNAQDAARLSAENNRLRAKLYALDPHAVDEFCRPQQPDPFDESPVMAFNNWVVEFAKTYRKLTQDEYSIAYQAFIAAHPGKGPFSYAGG